MAADPLPEGLADGLGSSEMPELEPLESAPGLLALMRLPGIGPARALAYAGGERPLDELDAEALKRAMAAAAEQVADYEEAGVTTVGQFDEKFPDALKAIPGAPAVIYFRGSPEAWASPALAVVGTRKPTSFGETATKKLTAAAVEAGFSIISGLALGIDGIAHEAALDAGGRTTAVLGSGLDSVSPRQHREMAERIVESGGALLCEQPFGTDPSARTLVARNRLQVGLAQALLVGQTGIKGGTMHTVRFAAEQGKPIYCPVPQRQTDDSAGLVVLLERPASELSALLPAWQQAGALAKRLGSSPLARRVRSEAVEEWIAELTGTTASPQQARSAANGGQLPLDGI